VSTQAFRRRWALPASLFVDTAIDLLFDLDMAAFAFEQGITFLDIFVSVISLSM
jgi:hypothetical protein